jgi:hypothetical protein
VRLLPKQDHPDLDDHPDHGYRSHPHYGDARDSIGFGWRRAGLAALVLAFAAATASLVQVRAGEGTVITEMDGILCIYNNILRKFFNYL